MHEADILRARQYESQPTMRCEAQPVGLGSLMSDTIAVTLLAWLARAAFLDYELAPSAQLTLLAGSCSLAGSLLLTNRYLGARARSAFDAQREAPDGERSTLILGGLVAVVFVSFALATGSGMEGTLLLALGCFLLVANIGAGLSLLGRLGVRAPFAASLIVTIAAGAAASSLWLGPLSELSRNETVVNAVLAVSPLTLLAVLADFDYLRTSWFYEHSVIGTLRYAYPPIWLMLAAHSLLPILSFGLGTRTGARRRRPTSGATR